MEACYPDPVLYSALDQNLQEIRLLTVEDVAGSSEIACRLNTISLDHNPQFTALSYVWGDPALTQDMCGHVPTARKSTESAVGGIEWSRNG
jgi:hypothetical protein